MYSLLKPSPVRIETFLLEQATLPFSYPLTGATHLEVQRVPGFLPGGYCVDHNRIRLGAGATVYAQAKTALQHWQMFNIGWIGVFPPPPIAEHAPVAILARLPGIWSLNAARIIYILEQSGAVERYGFAYGTLPDHAEQGEERFSVEWHHHDDSVWYDILAFSRPNQTLSRLGYPIARQLQRRFAVASLAAMRRAVI